MKSIKGSETEKNLIRAFSGEAQGQKLYEMISDIAKKEGYVQVANVLMETAKQEGEHALIFYKFFEENKVEMPSVAVVGILKDNTLDMLKIMASREKDGHKRYLDYGKTAKEEGFEKIAVTFQSVAICELYHSERFEKLASKLEKGAFKKDSDVIWECLTCGFLFTGKQPPPKCPACGYDKSYFQLKRENWLD